MRFGFLLVVLVFANGCGDPNNNPIVAPANSAVSAVNRAHDTVLASQLTQLTQAARQYMAEQGKAPASIEELVAKQYISSIPQPPAGKRFAFNKNLEAYLAE